MPLELMLGVLYANVKAESCSVYAQACYTQQACGDCCSTGGVQLTALL